MEKICPYFGRCGGCDYQNIPYEEQVARKIASVRTCLNLSEIKIFPSPPFHYRNRMDFVFFPNGIGFREKGKWYKFVDIEYCLIAQERINTLLSEVRGYFQKVDSFDVRKHNGTFRYAVIRNGLNSTVSFVLNQESKNKEEAIRLISNFSIFTSADNLIVCEVPPHTDVSISENYRVIKGTDLLLTKVKEKEFYFHSQGFFQINNYLIEKLHDYVSQILNDYKTENATLLDLYGGVGIFGIINRERFNSVIVVDNHSLSLDCVKKNCEVNNIQNLSPVLLEDRRLKQLPLPDPLFVIADPPRTGIHPKAIRYLNEIKPELIIYVSCNLNQLAKDLKGFTNYFLKSVALFDFFPQTKNMELVVELVRS